MKFFILMQSLKMLKYNRFILFFVWTAMFINLATLPVNARIWQTYGNFQFDVNCDYNINNGNMKAVAATSVYTCMWSCWNDPTCNIFTWNSKSNVCFTNNMAIRLTEIPRTGFYCGAPQSRLPRGK